ncbi:hypothetical protein CVT25_015427 [Psilocybe cyanescens]|uniref:CBM1 domain-containing protein n=1 Tax=Psilocybe cyanescens TaxID=93625 RepID=A0A409WHG3_PSICY|nr:hypothetical protein CVT25_015427 [Psilocybe cyanescens]
MARLTLILALSSAVGYTSAQSPLYGQCGGQGWAGATTCVSGSTCTYSNPYYSQCLPGAASSAPQPTTTTPATVSGGGPATTGVPSTTSTASGGSSTLQAGYSFIRAVEDPNFHKYLQSEVLNTASDAVLGEPSNAAQFQITNGQLIQNANGTPLYAVVEPRADSSVVKLKVSWSTTPATDGTFVFSGDTVEWSTPSITRPQNNAWLVCPDADGNKLLYVNLGAYDYMTPAGSAPHTTTTGTTPGGPSTTSTAAGGSPTLQAGYSFIRAVEDPNFHKYLQSEVLNTASDAVLGEPNNAAQFQITGGQLIQNANGKNLYAVVEPRANSTVVKLKVSWSTTPAASGTFIFSGDTVEWSTPTISRPQNNAWLVCPDAAGNKDLYVNLGPYSYQTPAGCADETIHAYTGATPTAYLYHVHEQKLSELHPFWFRPAELYKNRFGFHASGKRTALSQHNAPSYGQCGGMGWTGPTTCLFGWTCTYSSQWYSQCLLVAATTTTSPPGSGTTTVDSSPGGGVSTTIPLGPAPTLIPGWNFIRAVTAPNFHKYLQSEVPNTVSDAVLGEATTAAQFQITDSQLIQSVGNTPLYAVVEPRANSSVSRLKLFWSKSKDTLGAFKFSGDTVEWTSSTITRPQTNAWLICSDSKGNEDVYINLGSYGYQTPAGCNDHTIHGFTGTMPD